MKRCLGEKDLPTNPITMLKANARIAVSRDMSSDINQPKDLSNVVLKANIPYKTHNLLSIGNRIIQVNHD